MPRKATAVFDMEIDEVSTVDSAAAPLATIAIAKRHQEDAVAPTVDDDYDDEPAEIFDLEGNELERTDLEDGDVVFDTEGRAYEWSQPEPELELEREPQPVGKALGRNLAGAAPPRNPFEQTARRAASRAVARGVTKSLGDEVREALSKAVDDADRDEVIAKALEYVDQADERAAHAEEIAKSERDLRLDREYIAKAAEFNVPVPPERLGPVLKRMAESMSYDDCVVIRDCLTTSGEIFKELGVPGAVENDPWTEIEAMAEADDAADARIAKRNGARPAGREDVSKAERVSTYFESRPDLYDEYLSSRND